MSALTIYVAGGSAEREEIAGYLSQLRTAGWTVTYDWTADPGWTDPAHPRIESARADVRGIAGARFFWYVAPAEKSEGSHFELGVAWILGELKGDREIVVSGPADALGRVFPSLAGRRFAEHEEALAHLVRHAGRAYLGSAGAPEWLCSSCGVHRDERHRAWCVTAPNAYTPFPAEAR